MGVTGMTTQTPALDRIQEVIDESQSIGRFLDWLSQQGVVLAVWQRDEEDEDRLFSDGRTFDTLLHEYFNIDPKEEEREKRALLEELRSRQ